MKFIRSIKGQALVEYAVLVYFLLFVEAFLITGVIAALDQYVQGIYYILQSPFP